MRPILDIEPPQSQAELIEELNERFAAIGENFSLVDRSAGAGPASRTYTASPQPQSPYSYVNPVINAFEYLDPLYAQLRTAQMQLRELSLFPNSVGQNQLQIDSIVARHIVAGTITADKMNVNELSAIVANLGTITAGNITLDSSGFIRGGATAYNTGTGFWMGYNASAYKFFIGTAAGNKLLWDGTNLTITGSVTATTGTIGGFDIGTDYIRDSVNSFGLASTVTGGDDVRFWAGATFTNRGSAPFRITEAGVLTAASGTLGGWTISATQLSAGTTILDSTGGISAGSGKLTAAGSSFDSAGSTYALSIGGVAPAEGSGDRTVYIDFNAANSVDFNARILRNPGTNGLFQIATLGTGTISIESPAGVTINTSLGIGTNLTGGGVSTSTLANFKLETNPDTLPYCRLGMKVSVGSDGNYAEVDVNGGGNKWIRLYDALP